ncbi:hypothetical protein V2H45_02815 [Tumidithrix elongata RA019]|uniref:Lipoprotein n=1 Tax=Tumidithrix elongata BACA0141 TaxID=2716417 RepID=A0AAW9PXQ3_9CYAN|nr:hypothetical protein [Tumidithrix elongata RA019]
MPKYLIQKAALPVVALLMLVSACQPTTTPVASPPATTSPSASASPSTSPSASPSTSPSASASPSTSSGTFTAQSLAGEYTLVVSDNSKAEMEKSGIKKFEGKIVLKADGTFEGQLMIAGTPPADPKEPTPATPPAPKSSELKATGEFKVEGNMALLTTKSAMADGKEEKASPNVDKYTISADGKELKPEAQTGISFVKK